MMNERPWYEEYFGEDYLRIYVPFLTPERTADEIEGMLTLLGLPPGSAILDLCCGYGRHAIPLAQRDYSVTGQDLSPFFLRLAQADADAHNVHVRWVHGDMRHIPFNNEFDAAINIFTAFGYLETEAEDQKVLQQLSKALKPGGLFLLDTINREKLLSCYGRHRITRLPDGLLILNERRFDPLTSRNEVQVTLLYPSGQRAEYHHTLRLYTLTELARMLAAANLEVQAYYGGLDGCMLTLESERLVVVSRKVETPA